MSLINKNKVPQIFAQSDPALLGLASAMQVLKRWARPPRMPQAQHPSGARPRIPEGKEAEALRQDLLLAGVTRAQLFERSEHIEPRRFHDLRATFVTWWRRAGKDSGWISDRIGHLTKR